MKVAKHKYKKSINRIIIGDVGSGKTIVAFLIALNYLKSLTEGTVAMLAPTEVLAFQHYQKLLEYIGLWQEDFFSQLDVIYLSNKSNYLNGEKITKKVLDNRKIKKYQFFIGTHALLFKPEISANLVMVDEQHRFGVNQRQKLTQNTQHELEVSPHFLSFTATPIPRTLALTVFKSLQPHFLQTLSERKPIETRIDTFENLETKIVQVISDEISKNRKVYVICAKVEDKEEADDIWSIGKATTVLEKYFPGKILSVHGKLAEKKDILQAFKDDAQKSVLVATTVVEVGVDVRQASLVVILNAERFGLSALHQIRGRVGRNDFEDNQCILVTQKEYQKSRRLRYLCELQDGFKIAEKDLELRGGGDFLGKAQSGFGDEIENLLGLNPELYYQISEVVDQLDFDNLEQQLPRLSRYLEIESQKVWEE
jgi:ATP-dependent DNA helicase RecG